MSAVVDIEQKARFDAQWAVPHYYYRGTSRGELIADQAAEWLGVYAGQSVADYGCGTGRAAQVFEDMGLDSVNVDITRLGLDVDASYLPFIECPLWRLPKEFPITDWAFCVDVLEALPEEQITKTLANLAAHTWRGGYFQGGFDWDIDRYATTLEPFFNVVRTIPDAQKRRYGLVVEVRNRPTWGKPGIGAIFKKKYTPQPPPKTDATVVIVGHGPSLLGAGLGPEIDRFDHVIRFGDTRNQNNADWGKKVQQVVVSVRMMNNVINDYHNLGIKPTETWVVNRYGQIITREMRRFIFKERLVGFNPVICRHSYKWLKRYKEMKATGYIDPRLGNPGMNPSFTQGTYAIIEVCERINPRHIALVGFDNLWRGVSENFVSLVRTAGNELVPFMSPHDIRTERRMMDEIMQHYDVDIYPIGLEK